MFVSVAVLHNHQHTFRIFPTPLHPSHNPFAPTSPASVPLPDSPGTTAGGESPSPLAKGVNSKARPTHSITPTDATAVTAEGASHQGTKRGREDDDQDDEERPRVRQRTETYASGALGWLLMPFKSFINGFKEGLSSGRAPTTSTEMDAQEASSSTLE